MRKSFTKIYSRTLLLAITMCISFTMANAIGRQKTDTTYAHIQRLNKKDKNYLKTSLRVSLPLKPYVIPGSKPIVSAFDDKLLSNVQVYPNPVTDQINVKYSLSRNSNVSIKIMDVLGNEVVTLFSRRVEPGSDLKYSGNLGNKLQSGFYFVRVVVGTESVIKRISIL
jgi:hypothetical protein